MKQEVISMKSSIVFAALSSATFAATPMITDVMVLQRNPWNGRVDISYMVAGDIVAPTNEDGMSIALKVSATDLMTGSNHVANASALSGDMGFGAGIHKLV